MFRQTNQFKKMTNIQPFDQRHSHLMPLNELWKRYFKSLVFYANGIIRNDLEAEDIAIKVFEKVVYADVVLENVEKAKSFLYITTRNMCIDYLRTKQIHDRVHQQIIEEAEMVAEMRSTNDYDLMYAEYIQILYHELQTLPPSSRIVFSKLFFEQKTTAEVAAELGLSVQTVRNHKSKAVNLLKSAILKGGLGKTACFLQLMILLQNKD